MKISTKTGRPFGGINFATTSFDCGNCAEKDGEIAALEALNDVLMNALDSARDRIIELQSPHDRNYSVTTLNEIDEAKNLYDKAKGA